MSYRGRPRYPRRDVNQSDLVSQCRELGMIVWDLSNLGGKIPDLLIIWKGRCVPVEVKALGKRRRLTVTEKAGRAECALVSVDWVIAEDLDDILAAFGVK